MGLSTRTRQRTLAGVVVLGVAVAAGRKIAERHPAISRVAADLRSPILYLPFDLRRERALRVIRTLSARPVGPVAPGVVASERNVGGSAEAPDTRVVLYEPPGRVRPSGALLWIHGGGMVMGSPEQFQARSSAIAAEL